MTGSNPGSERWIVQLRTRAYSPLPLLQAARRAPTAAQRLGLLAQLEQTAAADQMEFVLLVVAAGGRVERHFWATNALAVEIPAAAVSRLSTHPRVLRLHPVGMRASAEIIPEGGLATPQALPVPISDVSNHNIAGAQAYLLSRPGMTGPASRGAGVGVAFFDTGIDADCSGANGLGTPHPNFVETLNPSVSRVVLHLRAGIAPLGVNGPVDANNISATVAIPGYGSAPYAYRPCNHSTSAGHGTGMAALACGNTTAGGLPDGHAPEATVVDISITWPPGNSVRQRWTTDDISMLNAIQMLRSVAPADAGIRILNISFDGWSDPDAPVCLALDEMAYQDDILILVSAGNTADDTRLSYGHYNGLAVGSVHARTSATGPFVPMAETGRGPLAATQRFYPDLCATGAGPGDPTSGIQYGFDTDPIAQPTFLEMPQVDLFETGSPPIATSGCSVPGGPAGTPISSGPVRFGRGTSEASSQVAGAAALYMAARLHLAGQVTAEEARAAILCNVLSPFAGANASEQHAYGSRNTFGLGYLRDDILAQFAARDPIVEPLHTVLTLTDAQPVAVASYPPQSAPSLTPGARYVAVICWPRNLDGGVSLIDNIDLEVLNGTTLLARSASTANNYERVAFTATSSGVSIRARLNGTTVAGPVNVQVAVRRFEPDFDPTTGPIEPTPVHAVTGMLETLDAGSSCLATARPLEPVRVVPLAYSQAYGSRPLNRPPIPNTLRQSYPDFSGLNIATAVTGGPGGTSMHIEISGQAVTNQLFPLPQGNVGGPISIGGLAFRTWRPFQVSGGLQVQQVQMQATPTGPVFIPNPPSATGLLLGPSTGATTVYNRAVDPLLDLPALASGMVPWIPFAQMEFPVLIPFATPFVYGGGGPNTTGNLHIWITWSGTPPQQYQVDGIDDAGVNSYGWMVNGAPALGRTPVIGLLPAPSPQSLPPRLKAFGEPIVGRSLDAHITQATAGTTLATLVLGFEQPGVGSPCSQFINSAQPTSTWFVGINGFGFGRQPISFPLNPALIHSTLAMQAAMLPLAAPPMLTNGLRITLGGGL